LIVTFGVGTSYLVAAISVVVALAVAYFSGWIVPRRE